MGLRQFDRFCQRLGQIALLTSLALLPLLLAETLARIFHDPPPLRRVYDAFSYRIPQPFLKESFEGPEGDEVVIESLLTSEAVP